MVTVVDAANLLKDYSSQDFLRDRGEVAGDADDRALVDLLVQQIEFADVIVMNKVSDASSHDLDLAGKIIRALNPDAELMETDFARLPLDKVLNTGRFDFEKAETPPAVVQGIERLQGPRSRNRGIRHPLLRLSRTPPLRPDEAQGLHQQVPAGRRAHERLLLATRRHYVGEISQAGALIRTGKRGLWWASVPKNQWPDHPDWKAARKSYLDPIWGDRRQEIVFIGCDPMDERQLRAELDACLVPERDCMPGRWRDLPDPFPSWEGHEPSSRLSRHRSAAAASRLHMPLGPELSPAVQSPKL